MRISNSSWQVAAVLLSLVFTVLQLPSSAQDCATCPGAAKAVCESGFIPIFNGKDLTGWDGSAELWAVENGVIVGRTSDASPIPYNKFLVWKDGELEDFELKLEYRIEGGNSGVQIRSFLREGNDAEGKPLAHSVAGYQADFDAARGWAGAIYGEGFGGILAKRGEKVVLKAAEKAQADGAGQKRPAKPQTAREVESFGDAAALQALVRDKDWNELHITGQGNRIRCSVNGTLMSEITDERPEARAKGILAFQIHRGPAMKVEFRNVLLKRAGTNP